MAAEEESKHTRREIISKCCQAAAIAAVAPTIWKCGTKSSSDGASPTYVTAKSTPSATNPNASLLLFSDYPDLQTIGSCLSLTIKSKNVYVTRVDASTATTVDPTCTHEGCTLNLYSSGQFKCPCHGATFAADGTVTGHPAKSNLTGYKTTIVATGIEVEIA